MEQNPFEDFGDKMIGLSGGPAAYDDDFWAIAYRQNSNYWDEDEEEEEE
eukprot:CAMPEP_0173276514 /NCGR_PEP_ID=MMETSP1143-20121109/3565_1 /TAXON_ID=483371 /ORGANISM="non described non described, Strain CCMP2298" /LENGTH=48 /DNA_ID= /DNA_START= /DNA_END= /DNA_ORIENTATION=